MGKIVFAVGCLFVLYAIGWLAWGIETRVQRLTAMEAQKLEIIQRQASALEAQAQAIQAQAQAQVALASAVERLAGSNQFAMLLLFALVVGLVIVLLGILALLVFASRPAQQAQPIPLPRREFTPELTEGRMVWLSPSVQRELLEVRRE